MDSYWGPNKYILLCIERFSKFPSAKITSSTSAKTVIEFLQDYIFLHGITYSIREDHATCFTSQNFKLFCDSNNIKIIFCTVGDHRSNGLVKKLVHTVKIKLLAISQEHQKCTLQKAVSKIIWNLRSSYKSKIKCSPFEIHYNRKPNTIWKQLASVKPSIGISDKGKSILSKERANKYELVAKKNLTPAEKGYDTDYAPSSKTKSDRRPLQSPFRGKLLRKTNGNINRDCFCKELSKRNINSSTSTVELSDRKIIRISDTVIPKSNSSKIKPFKGNISFPYFPNSNVEVDQKQECLRRKPKSRKPHPKTRKQVELASSDNLTRTRVSGPSSKPVRRQTRQSKKSTTPPRYLASDESMLIPSDISDTSDWEWIAGGFPCRDVARESFISDSCRTHIPNGISPNSSLLKINIKSELLEDITVQDGDQFGDQITECPISIIPASQISTSRDQSALAQAEEFGNSKLRELQVISNPAEKDTITDFPVYEIVDSADDSTPTPDSSNKPGNDPPTIQRSSRNVGLLKLYGQRYFINVVDFLQANSGSADNPIVLEIENNINHESNDTTTPAELVIIDSDSPSPHQISTSSIDEFLKMAVDNFREH